MWGVPARLPIDPAEALAAFQMLTQLRGWFPETDFRLYPTLIPQAAFAEASVDGTIAGCTRLAERVQDLMDLPVRLETLFVNEESAEEADRLMSSRAEGSWTRRGAAGVYYSPGAASDQPDGGRSAPVVLVDLASFVGASPEALVAVLAHEYSHHLLRATAREDEHAEELADLLPVLFGFGIMSANSAFTYRTGGEQVGFLAYHSWQAGRLGYLREDTLAFALAVTAAWKGEEPAAISACLGPAVHDCFRKTMRFLTSRRFTWWQPAAEGAEDLGAWLERRAAAAPEKRAPPLPAVLRVDVKWIGTFVGEVETLQGEDGSEWHAAQAVDYGTETRTIMPQDGVFVGIAYRLISNYPGHLFEVVEVVGASDGQARAGGGPSDDPPHSARAAFVPAGEIQFVLWPSDDPRLPRPAQLEIGVFHDEKPLVRACFTIEAASGP